MTPEAQLALINALPAILAAIFSGFAVIFGLINRSQISTVAKVTSDTQETGIATHVLVNSQRSELLLAMQADKRRIADLTHDPADIISANVARKSYDDHLAQQAVVNTKAGQTPPLGEK